MVCASHRLATECSARKETRSLSEPGFFHNELRNDDVVDMLTETRELKGGVLVFVGLKDVQFFPWPPKAKATSKKTATKKAAREATGARNKSAR